jgi:hypothetical protein
LIAADLDGDGRDELLFHDAARHCACRGDLTALWSFRNRDSVREVIPATPGRPATVVLNPSLGVDGATGRPIWSIGPARSILRATDGKSSARALTGPDGTTVCRVAMPNLAEGRYQSARGTPAKPDALHDDPRWQRPLPWVGPVEPYANPLVQLAMGATLINACIPFAILWLATRRRFWSVRLLLVLPAAVAIALTGSMTAISLIPGQPSPGAGIGSWVVLVAMLSMSGLPIVVYTAALASALARRRWWRLALLVSGVLVAAIVIGAIMLRSDRLVKPLIETYDWSGCHQAFFLGAYAIGVLVILSWGLRRIVRLGSRLIGRRRLALSTRS